MNDKFASTSESERKCSFDTRRACAVVPPRFVWAQKNQQKSYMSVLHGAETKAAQHIITKLGDKSEQWKHTHTPSRIHCVVALWLCLALPKENARIKWLPTCFHQLFPVIFRSFFFLSVACTLVSFFFFSLFSVRLAILCPSTNFICIRPVNSGGLLALVLSALCAQQISMRR